MHPTSAMKIRKLVEKTPFRFEDTRIPVTISLGVASSELIEDHAMEWDLLIKEADQRLYRAKHEGRNRVVAA